VTSRRKSRRAAGRASLIAGVLGFVLSSSGTALADVPVTQVSADPYTNTSSYHKTQVEPDTYSFGSTIVSTFQTGRFTDGGASNIGWATTTNNGATWTHGFLPGTTVYSSPPGPWARISDPSVAYDAEHDVWMQNTLGIDASVTGKAMLVSRSLDGGLTWGNPVTVSQGGGSNFYDKNWIACDNTPTSPHYGNCYVQWDDAFQGNALRMARSTNGGTTWTMSTTPNASVLGGQPLALPNGTVVVPIGNAFGTQMQSFISTNGGQSYTGPTTISSIQFHTPDGNLRDGGGLNSAEIDGGGRVYVAWADCRFRAGCSANDIVYSTSTNGTSWTAVKRIPAVPVSSSIDLFIPGFGADRSTSGATAHLGVTFYGYRDANCSVSTCRLLAGYVESTDGGATWSSALKLFGPMSLQGLPNTTLGYMVGDYVSTSFGSNGLAYPVIPKSTGSNCQLGQITSCNQFMVAPTDGLANLPGRHPVVNDPVRYLASPQQEAAKTAF
jgi:hypothetical protein